MAAFGHTGLSVSRRRIEALPESWAWQSRTECLESSHSFPSAIVIHLEVKQHVQNPTRTDLEDFERVNVGGTQQWLDWASKQGIKRFVFFSSIKAVGSSKTCQDESAESLPDAPYGQSKRRAEGIVRAWADADPQRTAIILRPAVVYGPGNQANMFSFVDGICRGRFFLVGKNDNIKSLISIRNLMAAVNHVLGLPLRGTELFYVTDKESYSVAQLASMIEALLDSRRRVRTLPVMVARSAALFGNAITSVTGRNFPITTNRLKALLETTHFSSEKLQRTGFVHPQSTQDGLKEMIDWYLKSSHASRAA